jgi:valyl-tRNA synthetase
MNKRYDHKLYEPLAQKKWHDEQTYKLEKHPGPLYSVDTPPPTVSGSLHIGHLFSYTQTDILARYKRMNGFSVYYTLGFDDNGLPTERYVEKKNNVRAHKIGRSAFITLCLQETEHAEKQFQALWQHMGLSVDWDFCYSTISPRARKISQESFIRLFKKKLIYRKYEPALYCTTCRTSVAQAELDDVEKASVFNTIVFHLEDGTPLFIGTTRPELLSSCVALLYNPHDERYTKLHGKFAIVPIFGNKIQIFADEQVDPQKGTGLVMCCTFGDKTDILWSKKYSLPYVQSIGPDGKWTKQTGILAGLNANQAREKIIDTLKENGFLKEQKPIMHAVNVHERCKKEIEYVALSQWFLKILDFKETFLNKADTINWYPAFMKSRYRNWVENISWDWCLSRQRFYGIPFPVWHCKGCDAILLPAIKDLPIDPQETPCPYKKCPQCSHDDIVPDTDVMDTWNTSSLTPYICYSLYNQQSLSPFTDTGITDFLPMSMRPQAHDIIRTWAFYTIVKTSLHNDMIPWHDIVISGHVLSDNTKEKLSKSKEQKKTDPEQLLALYPADAIRYWTASASLGHDVSFSDTQIAIGQRLLTKLWNAFRFIHEHIHNAEFPLPFQPHGIVNEWLLHQVTQCFNHYSTHLDSYEFNSALSAIDTFFWSDFCDNYLEIVKDQLFNPTSYNQEDVASTKATLYMVGLRILQMYSHYLPHITETIYEHVYKEKELVPSLHQTKFKTIQQPFTFDKSVSTMEHLITIISQVRKLKTEQQLSLKTDIHRLTIYAADSSLIDQLKKQELLIKGITRAQEIEYKQESLSQPALIKINDVITMAIGV